MTTHSRTTYTKDEVRGALRDALSAYHDKERITDRVVANLDSQHAKVTALKDADLKDADKVTVKEVRTALVNNAGVLLKMPASEVYKLAEEVAVYIAEHREPEYVPGRVYKDAYGRVFKYTGRTAASAGGQHTWETIGVSTRIKDGDPGQPVRPLREF